MALAGDDAKLAELILSLGLSTDQVRRDSARINEAEEKIPVIESQECLDAAYADALQLVDDLKARHKQALKEANDALNRASSEARRAGWFANDVAQLYHDAPELFAEGLIRLPREVRQIVEVRPAPAAVPQPESECSTDDESEFESLDSEPDA